MKNHFNIVRSFGLILLGIGIALICFTILEVMEEFNRLSRYGRKRDWFYLEVFVMLEAFFLIIAGMGNVLRRTWGIVMAQVAIIIGAILWNAFFFFFLFPDIGPSEYILAFGPTLFVHIILISFFLLTRNAQFLQARIAQDEFSKEAEDVLDNFLDEY